MRPLREPRSATEALRCGWLVLLERQRWLGCSLYGYVVTTDLSFCRLCPEWQAREVDDDE